MLTIAVAHPLIAHGSAGMPCPLRSLTGLPCPFCGMTRGVTAMVHGDVADAALFNPGSVLLVLAAVFLLVMWRVPPRHDPRHGCRSRCSPRSGRSSCSSTSPVSRSSPTFAFERNSHVDGTASATAPTAAPSASVGRRRRPPVNIGDAVGYGWNAYWKNVGPMVVIALVIFGINIVFSLIGNASDSTALQILLHLVGLADRVVPRTRLVPGRARDHRGHTARSG